MTKLLLRRALPWVLVPAGMFAVFVAFVHFEARRVRPANLAERLPDRLEGTICLNNVSGALDLAQALGVKVEKIREAVGADSRAVAGFRGTDVVVILECRPMTMVTPMDWIVADALGARGSGPTPRYWVASRRNILYVSTSDKLLDDALANSSRDLGIPLFPHEVCFEDTGALQALQARLPAMNDLQRFILGRIARVLVPRTRAHGKISAAGLELEGSASTPPNEDFEPQVTSQPVKPVSRIAAHGIPGLAWLHVTRFSAPRLWHEIVHDPDNQRFVGAFQHEIESYEKFLGGKDFETELLPHLGPERAFAVARIDYQKRGVRPKSPLPAILFACEVEGIEEEVLKSLDRFLREAEREGKRFDLPAPRGVVQPVLDPFSHDQITVEGVKLTRILFREGVSDFGSEFSPGYAVIDGVLWVTTFWPILKDIAASGGTSVSGQEAGFLAGEEARAVLRDNAGELAEMLATWDLLDRLAPMAAADFIKKYGQPGRWMEAMLSPFTMLENELKKERPDLKGQAFEFELEERLKAWEAQEKRAFAAQRATEAKKTPEFQAEVARRKSDIARKVSLANGVSRMTWEVTRGRQTVNWKLRVEVKPAR